MLLTDSCVPPATPTGTIGRHLFTAIRNFFNRHARVARAQSGANYVQNIGRLSRTTCPVPHGKEDLLVGWLVGCLPSQQYASVSQGRVCSENFTCCHTEIEVADPTFHHTQSQYTDTGPTSPSADPITPGAWQGSQWSANLKSLV